MDTKLQEIERRVRADKDSMGAYRLACNQLRAGRTFTFRTGVSIWEIKHKGHNYIFNIDNSSSFCVSKKISPILSFSSNFKNQDDKWTMKEVYEENHSFSNYYLSLRPEVTTTAVFYAPDTEFGLIFYDEIMDILGEYKKEFQEIIKLVSENIVSEGLKKEQKLLAELEGVRKEIGDSFLSM